MLEQTSRSGSAGPARSELRALHTEMQGAGDEKIRQIVGLVDGSSDNHSLAMLLDPLRPRLAALHLARPLRFARLLFTPVNDLLVPARVWKPGQAAIPRSVLKSLTNTVRVVLAGEVGAIEAKLVGCTTNDLDVVSRAGQMLWRRAGDILAMAPPAVGWDDTGLPASAYDPLARAIATVLRRAVPLRMLQREAEIGLLQPNEAGIAEVVSGMADEPAEGRVLVLKLVLMRCPHAAEILRRLTNSTDTPAERALLSAAMDAGVQGLLAEIEDTTILPGSLGEVGVQAQQVAGLLQDLGNEANSSRVRSRLKEIREKMDLLCRDRFNEGMQKGLVRPLATAPASFDAAGQRELETCARDLRSVETAGRKLGSAAAYAASLVQAGAAVEAAAEAGTLSRIRAVRLVEILAGPEQAEEFYRRSAQKK
jgi:hypothetical protein